MSPRAAILLLAAGLSALSPGAASGTGPLAGAQGGAERQRTGEGEGGERAASSDDRRQGAEEPERASSSSSSGGGSWVRATPNPREARRQRAAARETFPEEPGRGDKAADDDDDDGREPPARPEAAPPGDHLVDHLGKFVQDHRGGRLRRMTNSDARIAKALHDRAQVSGMEEFHRLRFHAGDGIMAQHLLNLFAARAPAAEGQADHFNNFARELQAQDLDGLRRALETAKTRMEIEARDEGLSGERSYALDLGQGSVDALLADIDLQGRLYGNGDERRALASAMEQALLGLAGEYRDALAPRLEVGDLSLNDLRRMGGQNAEVYRLSVDFTRLRAGLDGQQAGAATPAIFKPDGLLRNAEMIARVGLENTVGLRLALRQAVFHDIAALLGFGPGAGDHALAPQTAFVRFGHSAGGDADIPGGAQALAAGAPAVGAVYTPLDPADPRHGAFDAALTMVGKSWNELLAEHGNSAVRARSALDPHESLLDLTPARRTAAGGIEIRTADQPSAAFRQAIGKPALLRNLANAEVLDLLCGQIDRNAGNFFVTPDGRVTLIDNDQAFGLNDNPWSNVGTLPPRPGFMDRRMAEALLTTDRHVLVARTAGRLTTAEQEALGARFDALRALAAELGRSGRLVDGEGGAHSPFGWAARSADSGEAGRYYAAVDRGARMWPH